MSAKPVTQERIKSCVPQRARHRHSASNLESAASARSGAASATLVISSASGEGSQSERWLRGADSSSHTLCRLSPAQAPSSARGDAAVLRVRCRERGRSSGLPTARGSPMKSSLRKVKTSRAEEPKKDLQDPKKDLQDPKKAGDFEPTGNLMKCAGCLVKGGNDFPRTESKNHTVTKVGKDL